MYKRRTFKQFVIQLLNLMRSLSGFLRKRATIGKRASFLIDAPRSVRRWYFNKYCGVIGEKHLDCVVKERLGDTEALQQLRELGIVKYPISYAKEVELMGRSLFDFDSDHFSLPFGHELPSSLYENGGLVDFVNAYYGRQCFFREAPTIHFDSMRDYQASPPPSDILHSDGYRQVSLMLLLADLDENHIHMEYCLKSHLRQPPTYRRERIDQGKARESWDVLSVLGKAGDLFIFDTEGLHRGCYEPGFKGRQVFHQNFHPGVYPSILEHSPQLIPRNATQLRYRDAFGI